jgi:hypothetical protein
MTNLRGTVHTLLESGITPLPVNQGDKRPDTRLIPEWRSLQSSRPTTATVNEWLDGGMSAVAVVCGAASGGLFGIDFDAPRLYEAWRIAVGSLADNLYVEQSPSGGYHVFMRCPDTGGNAKLAWVPDDTDPTGRTIGIETRGEGGYMVVAPSPGYRVVQGDPANIPVVPQALADALLAAARKLDEVPFTRQERERRDKIAELAVRDRAQKRQARAGQESPVEAFNRVNDIRALLDKYGYTPGPGGYYTRPHGETPSVKVLDGRSIHWSSDDPLNDGSGKNGCGVHDGFDLYVHHEHGGEFSAAVRAAAQTFDIKPPQPSPSREAGAGRVETPSARSAPASPALASRPDYPMHALPKAMRELVEYGARAFSCPPEFVAAHVYPVASVGVGNRYVVSAADEFIVPAVVWGGTVADSGTGKTGPFRLVRRPLDRLQSKWLKTYEGERERYEEQVATYKRELAVFNKGKRPAPPPVPAPPSSRRAYIEQGTMEAIISRQRENRGGLGQFPDELSSIQASENQYRNGGSDLQNYLNMYDAGTITLDRQNKDDPVRHVPRAFLSISGNFQPAILRTCMREQHKESGTLARFNLVMPPRFKKQFPATGLDDSPLARMAQVIDNLLGIQVPIDPETGEWIPVVATLDAGADGLFREFYSQHQTDVEGAADRLLRFHYSKLDGGCLRFALINHLVRYGSGESVNPRVVDVESLANAVELIEWYKIEARRIYNFFREVEGQTQARELAEYIAGRGGKMPPSDLAPHRRWGQGNEDANLADVVRWGYGVWVQPTKTGVRGRPAGPYVQVNLTSDSEPGA